MFENKPFDIEYYHHPWVLPPAYEEMDCIIYHSASSTEAYLNKSEFTCLKDLYTSETTLAQKINSLDPSE